VPHGDMWNHTNKARVAEAVRELIILLRWMLRSEIEAGVGRAHEPKLRYAQYGSGP